MSQTISTYMQNMEKKHEIRCYCCWLELALLVKLLVKVNQFEQPIAIYNADLIIPFGL